MKKKISILLIFITCVFAAELNSNAKYIKNEYPEAYENIFKKHAKEKWEDDYEMAVYNVNQQADALFSLVDKFESSNTKILVEAMLKWSYDGYKKSNAQKIKKIDGISIGNLVNLHCKWKMVEYRYDNQVESKGSFW